MFGSKRLEFLYLMDRYMEKHNELSLYYHREQENFTYSEKESRIIRTQFFFRAPRSPTSERLDYQLRYKMHFSKNGCPQTVQKDVLK